MVPADRCTDGSARPLSLPALCGPTAYGRSPRDIMHQSTLYKEHSNTTRSPLERYSLAISTIPWIPHRLRVYAVTRNHRNTTANSFSHHILANIYLLAIYSKVDVGSWHFKIFRHCILFKTLAWDSVLIHFQRPLYWARACDRRMFRSLILEREHVVVGNTLIRVRDHFQVPNRVQYRRRIKLLRV